MTSNNFIFLYELSFDIDYDISIGNYDNDIYIWLMKSKLSIKIILPLIKPSAWRPEFCYMSLQQVSTSNHRWYHLVYFPFLWFYKGPDQAYELRPQV